MRYGLVYLMEGDWGLASNKSIDGYNFLANGVVEALNFVADDGWEFVSQIDYPKADNRIAYVVKKPN